MGHTATHAVVAARLITKGEDHGAHRFIVQLRNLKDHKRLPGWSVCYCLISSSSNYVCFKCCCCNIVPFMVGGIVFVVHCKFPV